MIKVIENKLYSDISVYKVEGVMSLEQDESEIALDKQGAKQLIKVLQEFVDEKHEV